jgi:SsrA-binding protein
LYYNYIVNMQIFNKRANFNYKLEEGRLEAGLVLSGGEAKAVRTGHADLSQSVARLINGELWLVNANIPIAGAQNYNSTRMRKLLLHKAEILSTLTKMKQRKLTLVPVKLYNKKRLIKIQLALGKSKHKFEKKESIKQKDITRELQEALKFEARNPKS